MGVGLAMKGIDDRKIYANFTGALPNATTGDKPAMTLRGS
jgi:hypothetical protein